jgi:hypothetical protein
MKIFNQTLFTVLVLALLTGCKKEGEKHPCYDKKIVHNRPCLDDCPGIVGCDGKTYCNECYAARQGIKPK